MKCRLFPDSNRIDSDGRDFKLRLFDFPVIPTESIPISRHRTPIFSTFPVMSGITPNAPNAPCFRSPIDRRAFGPLTPAEMGEMGEMRETGEVP